MIFSVHLADIGFGSMRREPTADEVPGLRYAALTTPAPLGTTLPQPRLGELGMVAAWDGDGALDAFLANHRLGERLRNGWHVRLQPLRASGTWSALPELEGFREEGDDEEPVAVVTLGRLRLAHAIRFLRASAPAERAAVKAPGVLASTGLARPPRLVGTFSLWRTAATMRKYAYGETDQSHAAAVRAHNRKPFHRESIFARFRPYHSAGEWDGRDPLGDVTLPEQSSLA